MNKYTEGNSKIQESKEFVFNRTNKWDDVFKYYIPEYSQNPNRAFTSPFRDEKTPSGRVSNKGANHYYFKDFGTGDSLNGIDFVMKKFNLSFSEALTKICYDLNITPDSPKSVPQKPQEPTILNEIITRPFTQLDLDYCNSYGWPVEDAEKFLQSVERYTLIKAGKSCTYHFTNKVAFVFPLTENTYKLYVPFAEKKYKHYYLPCRPVDIRTIIGYKQLPPTGDKVFITEGGKDVISIYSFGYPAISLNSASENPSDELITELKQRFKEVIVLFDGDSTGLDRGKKISEMFGLKLATIPKEFYERGLGKDVSDLRRIIASEGDKVFENSDILSINTFNEIVSNSATPEIVPVGTKTEATVSNGGFTMSFSYEKRHKLSAIKLKDAALINIGEIFTFVALPGSGKSQTCEILLCMFIARREGIEIDTLGFSENLPLDKMALLIDIERPQDQARDGFDRMYKRLGHREELLTETKEFKHITYKCWIEYPGVKERKQAFEEMVSTGNYGLVVLDGILGIINGMNDDQECTETIQWLIALANKYEFALVVTLHPNKGTENMAGHLGGFLYRYSRACLLLKSNPNDKDVKEITSSFAQGKLSYAGNVETYLRFSEDEKMFVSEDTAPTKQNIHTFSGETIRTIFNEFLLKGMGYVPATDMKARYMDLVGIKEDAYKDHIAAAQKAGFIIKEGQTKATRYFLNNGND